MSDKEYQFDFERLDVYKRAMDFVATILQIVRKAPSDIRYTLGSQMIRAAVSIVNNIAEGSGRSSKEQAQFFRIAWGSAKECIPMLSLLRKFEILQTQDYEKLRMACIAICQMLSRLVTTAQRRGSRQW